MSKNLFLLNLCFISVVAVISYNIGFYSGENFTEKWTAEVISQFLVDNNQVDNFESWLKENNLIR